MKLPFRANSSIKENWTNKVASVCCAIRQCLQKHEKWLKKMSDAHSIKRLLVIFCSTTNKLPKLDVFIPFRPTEKLLATITPLCMFTEKEKQFMRRTYVRRKACAMYHRTDANIKLNPISYHICTCKCCAIIFFSAMTLHRTTKRNTTGSMLKLIQLRALYVPNENEEKRRKINEKICAKIAATYCSIISLCTQRTRRLNLEQDGIEKQTKEWHTQITHKHDLSRFHFSLPKEGKERENRFHYALSWCKWTNDVDFTIFLEEKKNSKEEDASHSTEVTQINKINKSHVNSHLIMVSIRLFLVHVVDGNKHCSSTCHKFLTYNPLKDT